MNTVKTVTRLTRGVNPYPVMVGVNFDPTTDLTNIDLLQIPAGSLIIQYAGGTCAADCAVHIWQKACDDSCSTLTLAEVSGLPPAIVGRVMNASVTSIPASTDTITPFGTNEYEIGMEYDTTNGFVVPKAGYYRVDANVVFDAAVWDRTGGIASDIVLNLYKNGTVNRVMGQRIVVDGDYTGAVISVQGTALIFLAVGDKLKVGVNQNSSATKSVGTGTDASYFQVQFLGSQG